METVIDIRQTLDKKSRARHRQSLWKKAARRCEAKIREWADHDRLQLKRAEIIAALVNDPDTGPLFDKLKPPGSAANWPIEKGLKYIVHNFDRHCPDIWKIKNKKSAPADK